MGDADGDTCSGYYDAYPENCGGFDTADFTANVLCCACGSDISKYSF